MKTLIVKCVMMVIIVIGLVHYALYLKTGQLPWQSPMLGNLVTETLPAISLESVKPGSDKTRVYKWVDEQGVVNYSQEPPPDQANTEMLEIDPDVNLIQGTPVTAPVAAPRPRSVLIGDSSSSEGSQTPIEKAQAAKALLEARDREQKKILDSL